MFQKGSQIQPAEYTPGRAVRFYIPLVIQAISQSLTYPLVAAIVSHGANGVVDLAAFAQGQAVMFVIGAFGGGLITTGMVFGRDIEGLFPAFRRHRFPIGAWSGRTAR
jgi:Na+-driven multidrug efflux pump